jgi:drug/metabolite transporter (DMT)-like permease
MLTPLDIGDRNYEEINSKSVLIPFDAYITETDDPRLHKSVELYDARVGREHTLSVKSVVQDYTIGITFAILSSFWYALNVVCGKYALTRNPILTTYDVNFVRGIVSMIINSYVVYKEGSPIWKLDGRAIKLLALSNFFAVIRSYPLVWAYTYISGSKWTLIVNISPVLIVIMAGFILKEKITFHNYLIALVALLGWYILTLSKSESSVVNSNPILGYSFAFLSWIARSVTSLMMRLMNRTSINYMAFPFYYSIVLLAIGFFMYLGFDDQVNVWKYDWVDTVMLVIASLGTTLGMIFMSVGLKHLDASIAAPITNMEVIFAFIADILIFHYHFFLSDFLGALIIFLSLSAHIILQWFQN